MPTKGVWEKLLEILIDEPDYEWLMIDASHIKVHRTLLCFYLWLPDHLYHNTGGLFYC